MESATRLEITFKSGDTITYREGCHASGGYNVLRITTAFF